MEQRSLPGFGGSRIIRTADLWRHAIVTKAGCWEWSGPKDVGGYGIVPGDKVAAAHRLSFLLSRGFDAGSGHVCHHCDNPPCVRPDHLFLGSRVENYRDCMAKGRQFGYGKGRAKRPLTVGVDEFIAAQAHADAGSW